MRTRLTRVTTLLALMTLSWLPGPFLGSAQVQEPTAIIDPNLTDALEYEPNVKVLISLKPPSLAMEAWTTGIRQENAAERQAQVISMLTAADFTLIHQFELAAAVSGLITESGVQKLANHPDVLAIGMTGKAVPGLSQSVPLINAPLIHTSGYDGTGVDVAVLDTGIGTGHPDLSDNLIGEECFSQCDNGTDRQSGPGSAEDHDGHGTHVSGIITSNGDNDMAPVGVAPNADIFAYKVCIITVCDEDAMLQALQDIESRSFFAEFVNMSIWQGSYGQGTCNPFFPGIEDQIDWLLWNGVLSFAISGNSGAKSGISWPACYSSVVSVGAVYDANIGQYVWQGVCTDTTTAADKVACWSNSSSDLELLAPGCDILSTWHEGFGVASLCGTSMAAPHAVGVAALLLDAQPGLTAIQIKTRLKATGQWVKDDFDDGDPATFRWLQRIDARVASLTNDNGDNDLDGCANGKEYGAVVTLGGQRNPLDRWDFYDVDGFAGPDKFIDLGFDVLGVILHYAPSGAPPYDVNFDRGPIAGPYAWSMTAPDGVIDLGNDILGVINQYGHDCR